MKICILTQPLHTNYGGILQAYALQTILNRRGHEVMTEDRRENNSFINKLKRNNFIRSLFGKERICHIEDKDKKIIVHKIEHFIQTYIKTTPPIYSTNKRELKKMFFEVFVVGSDQVWRPIYSPGLFNYFLDFTKGWNVKRIAYAASFGTDEWEFTVKQTAKCSELAKQFDAISVREDSGVGLCQTYLGVNPIHLLDPTMLLEKQDYVNLVTAEKEAEHNGNIMAYFLDKNEMKDSITQLVCRERNGTCFYIMPEKQYSESSGIELSKCIYPSVTSWIKGFMDADYIVTDSFHGTVFSIIFNKPFLAIANKERGVTRFSSLLKILGLEDRLIFSDKDLTKNLLIGNINFDRVNSIIKSEQAKAFMFLEKCLL
ncbi:polysaccharide pyruvyl transferase family protein [Bacteroides acidifaciens]|uniref:polysaccharide pyruvyl transferase family protein n=1 Tax=Bacteroides acidifaciens TaxID=85831 RepID=UPI0025AA1F7E|nr:polysaccharide pyruvyl transferase family protein [Bacteroides acidifaciens]